MLINQTKNQIKHHVRLGDCILRLVRKFMNWEILYNTMKYISQKYSKGNVLKKTEREREDKISMPTECVKNTKLKP